MANEPDPRFASPACLLNEADPDYRHAAYDAGELATALAGLIAALDGLRRTAGQIIRTTDDPAILTQAQRIGRLTARHGEQLTIWLERLGGTKAAVSEPAPGYDQVMQLFARLLPRVADPALHGELLKMQELLLAIPMK